MLVSGSFRTDYELTDSNEAKSIDGKKTLFKGVWSLFDRLDKKVFVFIYILGPTEFWI